MGSSGMKRKGRQHLPKVGTRPERESLQYAERRAIAENFGLHPHGRAGEAFTWIVMALVGILVALGILALIALD